MITDEELWIQDVELSILTAKVYKELGVLDGIMNYSTGVSERNLPRWVNDIFCSLG